MKLPRWEDSPHDVNRRAQPSPGTKTKSKLYAPPRNHITNRQSWNAPQRIN